MGANIEWARPEITECWSFQGRLYKTHRKAQIERNSYIKHYSDPKYSDNEYVQKNLQRVLNTPIYKVTWTWEEDT